MPFLVTCPSCSTKLKSAQPVPAGRTLTCPQCKTTFTLSAPAPEIEGTAERAASTPPAGGQPVRSAPPPSAPPPPPVRPSGSKASSARDDEADLPEAEIVDAAEFEEAPRPRRRREEDDRPRARRRRDSNDDEDEDDRPRRRRKAVVDDEEDDRPRARRRRDSDDEDEDLNEPIVSRSRSRVGRKAQNKKLLLILGLAGAAAVLFLGVMVGFYLVDPFGLFRGKASSDMLAWVPADAQMVSVVDMNEARQNSVNQNGLFGGTDPARLGLNAVEIDTILTASSRGGLIGNSEDVMVIKLNEAIDQKLIISACGGREASAHGKQYYKTNTGGGLYFASSRIVVSTKSENTILSLLQKNDSMSSDLRSAIKGLKGTQVMAAIDQSAAGADFIAILALDRAMFGPMAGPGAVRSAVAKRVTGTNKVSGNRGTLQFSSTYDSSETAQRIATDLRKNLESRRPTMNDIDDFEVATSGSTVTLTLHGTVKGKQAAFPFGR